MQCYENTVTTPTFWLLTEVTILAALNDEHACPVRSKSPQYALEPMPWRTVAESSCEQAGRMEGTLVLKPDSASAAGGRFDRVLPYFIQQGLVADFETISGLLAMPVCFL